MTAPRNFVIYNPTTGRVLRFKRSRITPDAPVGLAVLETAAQHPDTAAILVVEGAIAANPDHVIPAPPEGALQSAVFETIDP